MDEILGPLTEILEGVLQADQQLMEKTKAKVFSAFITVLQMKEMRGEEQRGEGAAVPRLHWQLVWRGFIWFPATHFCFAV